MKLARIFCIALALLSSSSLGAMQLHPVKGDQRQADRDAIHSHIDKIFQAYIRKDADVIRATHSQDWLGFVSNSRTTVHGIDQYMSGATGFIQSPVRLTAYRMVEFDVLFYGDVAIVPYIADVDYELQGQRIARKLRVLDVYAKMAGQWIQVSSNTQLHPDSIAAQMQENLPLDSETKKDLLAAREAVWRDYFANDAASLGASLPPELIAIDYGDKWHGRSEVLDAAKDFAAKEGKLIRLEFPQTEIQMYGSTAIVYSKYLYEIEVAGKRTTQSGRATEMFVNRQGKWLNVGWHLDFGS